MATNNPEEIDFAAFRAGDEQAFAHVFTKYSKVMFSQAAEILTVKQDVEDICQETLTALYENRQNIADENHIRNWLRYVARLKSLNLKRSKKSEELIPPEKWEGHIGEEDEPQSFLSQLTTEIDKQIIMEDVATLAERLKPQLRDTLKYLYIEGLSFKETAALMNVALSVVYYRHTSAKKAIREMIDNQTIKITLLLLTLLYAFFLKKIFAAIGI